MASSANRLGTYSSTSVNTHMTTVAQNMARNLVFYAQLLKVHPLVVEPAPAS